MRTPGVLFSGPATSCLVVTALRHFDVIICPQWPGPGLGSCWQLQLTTELHLVVTGPRLGPDRLGLAISGLGPLSMSGRCLESEAPIRYPSLKRPGLQSGAPLIRDETLVMRFKSWHLSCPHVPPPMWEPVNPWCQSTCPSQPGVTPTRGQMTSGCHQWAGSDLSPVNIQTWGSLAFIPVTSSLTSLTQHKAGSVWNPRRRDSTFRPGPHLDSSVYSSSEAEPPCACQPECPTEIFLLRYSPQGSGLIEMTCVLCFKLS